VDHQVVTLVEVPVAVVQVALAAALVAVAHVAPVAEVAVEAEDNLLHTSIK
jgi:hypothetical protein